MKRPSWWKPPRQRSRLTWFAALALRWALIYAALRVGVFLAAGGHLGWTWDIH